MDIITWGNVKHISRGDAQAIILERSSPEPNTGCWLWVKSVSTGGYGQLPLQTRPLRHGWGHRLSYEAFVGQIPNGLQVDHLCRVRCCVNPDHLEPVTPYENMRRSTAWKFHASKTHCLRGHPFDADNTKIIVKRGRPTRRCKACHREGVSRRAAAAKVKREAKHAYMRAYYHNNKERESARKAEWYRARGKSLRKLKADASTPITGACHV